MKGRYEMVHSFLTDIVNFIQEQITERFDFFNKKI